MVGGPPMNQQLPTGPGPSSGPGPTVRAVLPDRLKNRSSALAVTALAITVLAAGVAGYLMHRPQNLIRLELQGRVEAVAAVDPLALRWDLGLIVGYVGAILVLGYLGQQVFVTQLGTRSARAATGAGLLLFVAAFAANLSLARAMRLLAGDHAADAPAWAVAAQGFSFATAMLLVLAVPVAAAVPGVVLARSVRPRYAIPDHDVVCGVRLLEPGQEAPTHEQGGLQVLGEKRVLAEAHYLVAVSGGAYSAGAMQLAQCFEAGHEAGSTPCAGDGQRPPRRNRDRDRYRPPPTTAGPQDVFANGSPEFDYVRRHAKYLADGTGQWLAALGVVLRGVIVVQLMLFCLVILLGLGLGKVYKAVPSLRHSFEDAAGRRTERGISQLHLPPLGIWAAVAVTLTAAIVVWLLAIVLESQRVTFGVAITAPGPSGSAEPTRLCRGCSHLPRRPPDQAASSFTPPLRRQSDGWSLTSIRNDSASWRSCPTTGGPLRVSGRAWTPDRSRSGHHRCSRGCTRRPWPPTALRAGSARGRPARRCPHAGSRSRWTC